MKKALVVPLSDEELLDLCRILIDHDEAGALAFLDQHLKKKVNQALEGG
jgi:regulator of sigma D